MPDRGQFIVIVGPDGTGKTTLAHAIADRLGGRSKYFHFLPRPLWRLSDQPGPPGELVDKHAGGGNRLPGWVRLARNVAKSWLGYWLTIGPALRAGKTVVGDRYLYGYSAQPIPLKFYGPSWLAHLALRLIPKPDLVVILDAPTQVVRSRKPELSSEQIETERRAWQGVATHAVVLDSTKPPATLVDELLVVLKLPTRLYPPGIGHVAIPDHPRSYALYGTSLYAPSRRPANTLHRTARLATSTVGARWLKTAPEIDVPLGTSTWAELIDELQSAGIPVERVAIYRRLQENRAGFSFLALADGKPTGFVRVNSPGMETEIEALGRVATSNAKTFDHPVALCDGWAGRVRWAAFTPVLSGFHRPDPQAPIALIAEEVRACLEGLTEPEGTLPHWQPMHGDFTPWNLRRQRDRLVLIDWERAGWGPPGADATLYWATARAIGTRHPNCTPAKEAAEFWLEKLPAEENKRDRRLRAGIERTLRSALT